MFGIALDSCYHAVAHARQQTATDAAVGTVRFFPALDAVIIFFHSWDHAVRAGKIKN